MTRTVIRLGMPICRQFNMASVTPVDSIPVEGDNYVFRTQDFQPKLYLKDEAGGVYSLDVTGDLGFEEMLVAPAVFPGPVSTPPIGNPQETSAFFTDNYLRWRNTGNLRWSKISADTDETFLVHPGEDEAGLTIAGTSDANTFNVWFRANPVTVSMFFRHIATGALYKPWVVDEGGGLFTLTLQLTPLV